MKTWTVTRLKDYLKRLEREKDIPDWAKKLASHHLSVIEKETQK